MPEAFLYARGCTPLPNASVAHVCRAAAFGMSAGTPGFGGQLLDESGGGGRVDHLAGLVCEHQVEAGPRFPGSEPFGVLTDPVLPGDVRGRMSIAIT